MFIKKNRDIIICTYYLAKVAEKVELISEAAEVDDDGAVGIAQHYFPKNLYDISRLL